MNKKYLKPSQPDHKIFLTFFSNASLKVLQCCGAAEHRGSCQAAASDERDPQGPRILCPCFPWDQGTASTCPSSTVTLKTAGQRRSRFLPCISPQTSSFQRGSYSGADFAKAKPFLTGLAVPWRPSVPVQLFHLL